MDGISSTMLAVFGIGVFLGGTILTFTSVSADGGKYRPFGPRLAVSLITGVVMAVIAMLVYIFVALN